MEGTFPDYHHEMEHCGDPFSQTYCRAFSGLSALLFGLAGNRKILKLKSLFPAFQQKLCAAL